MSSSYKQKKMKTLATRKKTRKRRMEDGMTFEDDSGRLFQPPSTRDPRWKKPSIESLVSSVSKSKRQKKAEKKRRKIAANQVQGEEDDEIEVVQREAASCDEDGSEEEEDEETAAHDVLFDLPKTPLRLCKSMDDAVAKAAAKHAEIRRKDGRQKTKVLLLVDARSLFKLMKKTMHIRPEMVKPKSRLGVGSAKKPELVYKNTGLVKTPLDRFKDVNKVVLTGYKSGKLSSILAEDLSFYPYTEFKVQHVIFVAKQAASAINLDRNLLRNIELHSFVIDDKSAAGISDDDLKALHAAFEVTSP
ncbi:hypothetical protein PF005_g18978 [Phytophthora fragariae]|uniref:Uncharacterized protein n=1 Tax=Phytophthora fragariae TaxID=53985 RepID=A0A6A3WXR5_9STRA|nr:hypothetical protein PF009_g10872 [Phytophthora fragariae]KAE9013348.1 hypothetical protein PF011_g8526 [Phytophthora fragariae]KAE9116263.1 hypothetical protein PF007_g9724 [Phytophthora fragariae]KAE9117188.1 hypothetical protein PF010_g8701 [Phytophthora fragariae]KAE9146165.1 hypothetical protein PF006_g9048 [Phytophthora fragariae]